MPQFCMLFSANYTILATQMGGGHGTIAPPPLKYAPASWLRLWYLHSPSRTLFSSRSCSISFGSQAHLPSEPGSPISPGNPGGPRGPIFPGCPWESRVESTVGSEEPNGKQTSPVFAPTQAIKASSRNMLVHEARKLIADMLIDKFVLIACTFLFLNATKN